MCKLLNCVKKYCYLLLEWRPHHVVPVPPVNNLKKTNQTFTSFLYFCGYTRKNIKMCVIDATVVFSARSLTVLLYIIIFLYFFFFFFFCGFFSAGVNVVCAEYYNITALIFSCMLSGEVYTATQTSMKPPPPMPPTI